MKTSRTAAPTCNISVQTRYRWPARYLSTHVNMRAECHNNRSGTAQNHDERFTPHTHIANETGLSAG